MSTERNGYTPRGIEKDYGLNYTPIFYNPWL